MPDQNTGDQEGPAHVLMQVHPLQNLLFLELDHFEAFLCSTEVQYMFFEYVMKVNVTLPSFQNKNKRTSYYFNILF